MATPWPRSTGVLALAVLAAVGLGAAVALWTRPAPLPGLGRSIPVTAAAGPAEDPVLNLERQWIALIDDARSGAGVGGPRFELAVLAIRQGGPPRDQAIRLFADRATPEPLRLDLARRLASGGKDEAALDRLAVPLLGSAEAAIRDGAFATLRGAERCVEGRHEGTHALLALCPRPGSAEEPWLVVRGPTGLQLRFGAGGPWTLDIGQGNGPRTHVVALGPWPGGPLAVRDLSGRVLLAP